MGKNTRRRNPQKTRSETQPIVYRIVNWWTWKNDRPKRLPYLWTTEDVKAAMQSRLAGGSFIPPGKELDVTKQPRVIRRVTL